ncbi:hypothetical protein AB0N16_00605 [Streptomyces sp. NPDC051105]|uniref:hypothetical protein n=1 Tax=Streptomyces sp. NPDC051105 TaxID=3154843 RepID=UPI00341F7D5C
MSDFAAPAAPLRPQILALCYRMLGSAGDAEGATQETCPGGAVTPDVSQGGRRRGTSAGQPGQTGRHP